MEEDTLKRIQELDEKYFGNRSVSRLVRALAAQVRSMEKEPTSVNLRKQSGDALFVLVAMARNNSWDLEDLLRDVVVKLENRRRERHYYEAHVTLEPVFEERLEELKEKCGPYGFHVASLLMQKRPGDTPARSANDSFCTARGISYSDLEDRMVEVIRVLTEAGFKVWRYKIESTLLDSRYSDALIHLDHETLPAKERNPRAPADGALSGRLK